MLLYFLFEASAVETSVIVLFHNEDQVNQLLAMCDLFLFIVACDSTVFDFKERALSCDDSENQGEADKRTLFFL